MSSVPGIDKLGCGIFVKYRQLTFYTKQCDLLIFGFCLVFG